MNFPDPPLTEREQLVVRLRDEEKLSGPEIGGRLGVSRTRVGQIYAAASAKLKDFAENGADALSLLPPRVRRVLVDCKLGSRALARSAIESGQLSWNEAAGNIRCDGGRLPKLGRRTWVALCEWTGQPTPPPKPDVFRGYPANGLSYRANHCLSRAHIPATKPAVILALTTGVLSPYIRGPNRYSMVTHVELCRWAGLDPKVL